MRSREIEGKKKHLKLSQKQRDILVGLLLGDGHLETQNDGRTYRLKIEHSINQREYVDYLYKEFKNWCNQDPKVKNRGGKTDSYYFTTYSHGSFRFYGQQFYPKGKKVIPDIVSKLISPIGLAIWFMDDGSLKSKHHSTYVLHTLGYTKMDLERMKDVLKRKFSIDSRLHKQKDRYWRIYILSESSNMFRKLVEKYIVPSMRYKLGNTMPKE